MLTRLGAVRKYCRMNSRFIRPEQYRDRSFLAQLAGQVDILLSHDSIDGIVFSDFYFLAAVSGHSPLLAKHLEAVPGVNCMLDDAASIFICLDMILLIHQIHSR